MPTKLTKMGHLVFSRWGEMTAMPPPYPTRSLTRFPAGSARVRRRSASAFCGRIVIAITRKPLAARAGRRASDSSNTRRRAEVEPSGRR
jgi:hypothetical protein